MACTLTAFKFPAATVLAILATLCGSAAGPDESLVAAYNFDEGAGSVARDQSGHGNDGQIHGARYIKRGKGYCLEFDGVHDYVDCGNRSSLDLRSAVTLEAWVFPAHRVKGEPGILGKHFESYLLTYYADGQCWWYVSSGGNNAKTILTPGSWHLVISTFDGKVLKLYVDGFAALSVARKAEAGGSSV